MIAKNDTVVEADGSEWLVTRVNNESVYAVPAKAVDESGTAAGSERYLGTVEEFERGERGDVCAAN